MKLHFLISFVVTGAIISIALNSQPSTAQSSRFLAQTYNNRNIPSNALARNRVNFSLLVGEWAEQGKCNTSRIVFMQNGRYKLIQRKGNNWKTFFNGFYGTTEPNTFFITNNEKITMYSLNISKLTRTMLAGMGVDEDESEPKYNSWNRCPNH